jgi:hypothetical protein
MAFQLVPRAAGLTKADALSFVMRRGGLALEFSTVRNAHCYARHNVSPDYMISRSTDTRRNQRSGGLESLARLEQGSKLPLRRAAGFLASAEPRRAAVHLQFRLDGLAW